MKTLRHDSDDRAFQAIEVRLPADDIGITRKNALPRAVGNIGHHLRSGYIVRLGYQASLDWRHGKRFQESTAHVGRRDAHGLRFSRQVRSAGDPRVERGPRMRITAQIEEFRPGSPESVQTAVRESWKFGIDPNELFGV